MSEPLTLWRAVRRGIQRRCPACGEGALFIRRLQMHRTCSLCGVKYLDNPGDPWGFFLVLDRLLFIGPAVVAVYLGIGPRSQSLGLWLVCGVAILLLIGTTPHRYGVAVNLDYFIRKAGGHRA